MPNMTPSQLSNMERAFRDHGKDLAEILDASPENWNSAPILARVVSDLRVLEINCVAVQHWLRMKAIVDQDD